MLIVLFLSIIAGPLLLSSRRHFYNYLIIFFIWILFSFNNNNQDYEGYVAMFDYEDSYGEVGYRYLIDVFNWFGFSHNEIIFFVGTFWAFTIIRVFKHGYLSGFLLIGYLFYPFIENIIQLRDTIALSLLINSLEELTRRRRLRSILFVCAAPFFHTIAVTYVILYFLLYCRKEWLFYRIIYLAAAIIFIVVLIGFSRAELTYFGRASMYLSSDIKFQNLIFILFYLFDIFMLRAFLIRSHLLGLEYHRDIFIYFKFIFSCLIFMPLMLSFNHFFRFFSAVWVIQIILLSKIFFHISLKERVVVIFLLMFVALPLGIRDLFLLNGDWVFGSNRLLSH